jgi:hypothetical protein
MGMRRAQDERSYRKSHAGRLQPLYLRLPRRKDRSRRRVSLIITWVPLCPRSGGKEEEKRWCLPLKKNNLRSAFNFETCVPHLRSNIVVKASLNDPLDDT